MNRITRLTDFVIPLGALACVLVLLVPLPSLALDILLAGSITVSLLVLLTTIYVRTPLEFNLFPTLLLGTTLARLVLNVASTRLILSNGASQRLDAAGAVVRSFGEFVAGERLVVGFVMFLILVAIQFLVISKGATRISEVAARFALDGLPGRQMAIDADVRAGVIDQAEAHRRRDELSQHADFYAAMDGASKFLRGDAVAGVVITAVNIVGGLFQGLTEGGMSLSEAVDVYTRLTIGDGLVSQVPALLVSLAAGLLVTRSGQRSDLPAELLDQLVARPRALAVAAGFLLLLSATSLPFVPLASLGLGCAYLAWRLGRPKPTPAKPVATTPNAAAPARADSPKAKEDRIEDLLAVDPLEVELGVGLIRLADPHRGGDLLRRVTAVRQSVAAEIGVVLPKVRIRDNLRLAELDYRIKLAGNVVATGSLFPDRLLALDAGMATGPLAGQETVDAASNLPAVWIAASTRERAESQGYVVQEPAAALATHLQELVREHADELLTRDAARHLVDELRRTAPAAVDELVPQVLRLAEVQQVLQLLLRERVPIRQLSTILETLGDHAARTRDPRELAERVRQRLGRTICGRLQDAEQNLYAVTLDTSWEEPLERAAERMAEGLSPGLTLAEVESLCAAIGREAQKLARLHRPAVLVVHPAVRSVVRQLTGAALPRLTVLSFAEIPRDTRLESVGLVRERQASGWNGDEPSMLAATSRAAA